MHPGVLISTRKYTLKFMYKLKYTSRWRCLSNKGRLGRGLGVVAGLQLTYEAMIPGTWRDVKYSE